MHSSTHVFLYSVAYVENNSMPCSYPKQSFLQKYNFLICVSILCFVYSMLCAHYISWRTGMIVLYR